MRRLKPVGMALLTFALIACGPKAPDPMVAVKEALGARLKDPSSIEFRNLRTIGMTICGEYNAKNGFGGYVGFEPFYAHTDDAGSVEVLTAHETSLGSSFTKAHETACADRSGMSQEERDADFERRLDENRDFLRGVEDHETQSKAYEKP